MCDVVMTADDRSLLAALLLDEQRRRFGGMKKSAYTAAQVSQATWDRAIAGESIKDHKVHQIVVNLWPVTEGDWQKIPGLVPVEDSYDALLEEIEHADFSPANRAVMRAAIEAQRRGQTVRLARKRTS